MKLKALKTVSLPDGRNIKIGETFEDLPESKLETYLQMGIVEIVGGKPKKEETKPVVDPEPDPEPEPEPEPEPAPEPKPAKAAKKKTTKRAAKKTVSRRAKKAGRK